MKNKYLVVLRVGDRYWPARSELDLLGVNPDEIWIFGEPDIPQERAIALAVMPLMIDSDFHLIETPLRTADPTASV